jgi:DNA processing protein
MNLLDDENAFDDEEVSLWLALDQMTNSGIGPAKARSMFEYFGSFKQAWKAQEGEIATVNMITDELARKFVEQRKAIDPAKLLETCRKAKVEPYPIMHPLYPQLLRGIDDPPLILYVRGSLHPDFFNYSIALVGTRKPTSYGRSISKELANGLARHGVTVVSGLAIGVDSLAHWGALEGGGRTIAVLACGPDICYPTSNKPLYEKLVSGDRGAVVSEFFPGTKPEPWRFPARNRIISGLSRGVVVVEAGVESGALITAEIAFNQGHVPFAVPGRVDSPMSAGTNALIRRSKATLVRNVADIMHELNWQSVMNGEEEVPCVVQLFGRENEIFELVSREPIHFDHLCFKSGMAAGELSATLTMLELAGIVTRHPGDWYSRSSNATVISQSAIP